MIKNLSNNKILTKRKNYCKSIVSKASGLMFSSKTNRGLVFFFDKKQKMSLHMFFVFYPLDVLFLDEKKKVVEIKKNFKPFTFYNSKKEAMYFIELPAGTVKKTDTLIGDKIGF